MTAPFAIELCGYRPSGTPSTSDANDKGSIEWGHALFDQLGVPAGQPAGSNIGDRLESAASDHLSTVRTDLVTGRSRSSKEFAQYRHLGAFQQFQTSYVGPAATLNAAIDHLTQVPTNAGVKDGLRLLRKVKIQADRDHQIVLDLQASMPQESLLKLDLTIGDAGTPPRLLVAVSCKWSLRTDRAQDCISQGNKLVSLRRGPMPHYSALTMEPRPAMLKLLAYGSGAVDCVYHVALPQLLQAAKTLERRKRTKSAVEQSMSLNRMVEQGRLRSYDDLVSEVARLPA